MEKTLEELLKEVTPEKTEDQLKDIFENLAEELINNCHIVKQHKEFYDITDIEFYYCSKNHFDLTVYPRNTNIGEWFFHQSGVDLTFQSSLGDLDNNGKIKINSNFGFGGILIRGIRPVNNKKICGSLKTEWELFDKMSALNSDANSNYVPIIVKREQPLKQELYRVKRHNIERFNKERLKTKLLDSFSFDSSTDPDIWKNNDVLHIDKLMYGYSVN
jgi:hypothetical protein